MLPEPTCFKRGCKHYIGIYQTDGTEMTEKNVCEAFPVGIPIEISYGDNDHTEPYPNAENPQDNGIRFEPIDEA